MAAALAEVWPRQDPALSLVDALAWVYEGPAINRIGIREMRAHFTRGPLTVEWEVPLMDANRDRERLALVSRTVGLTPDELMTKGLTLLLRRA
jgi:hypothetical protein